MHSRSLNGLLRQNLNLQMTRRVIFVPAILLKLIFNSTSTANPTRYVEPYYSITYLLNYLGSEAILLTSKNKIFKLRRFFEHVFFVCKSSPFNY